MTVNLILQYFKLKYPMNLKSKNSGAVTNQKVDYFEKARVEEPKAVYNSKEFEKRYQSILKGKDKK